MGKGEASCLGLGTFRKIELLNIFQEVRLPGMAKFR
jgi:hypothetical protein